MLYLQADGNVVSKYPLTLYRVRQIVEESLQPNQQTISWSSLNVELPGGFFSVAESIKPTDYISLTQGVRETTPIKIGEQWTQQWEIYNLSDEDVAENLETERESKLANIKFNRAAAELNGFPYLGKVFDSDTVSRQRIFNEAMAAQIALSNGQSYSVEWITKDNTMILLSAEQLVELPGIMAAFSNMLASKANALKQSIIAAVGVSDMLSINTAQGWDITEITTKPTVIVSVDMKQARLALLQKGLLDSVEAALNSIEDNEQHKAAMIEWNFSKTVRRDSLLVQSMIQNLPLTESQADELFELASSIK